MNFDNENDMANLERSIGEEVVWLDNFFPIINKSFTKYKVMPHINETMIIRQELIQPCHSLES